MRDSRHLLNHYVYIWAQPTTVMKRYYHILKYSTSMIRLDFYVDCWMQPLKCHIQITVYKEQTLYSWRSSAFVYVYINVVKTFVLFELNDGSKWIYNMYNLWKPNVNCDLLLIKYDIFHLHHNIFWKAYN